MSELNESKDCKTKKTFDALDWLALLITHIPNRDECPLERGLRYGACPPLTVHGGVILAGCPTVIVGG